MSVPQLYLRNRVVQFLEAQRKVRSDWKADTVSHFTEEGFSRPTIYRTISTYLARGSVEHGKGAGRPVKIMTPGNKNRLRRAVNNTTGVSQNRMAAKFGCSQPYISKTLKNGYRNPIKCRTLLNVEKELHNVNVVPKDMNPPNMPQCRPIEDFFGALATKVYDKNWVAADVGALERRVRSCVAAFPVEVVL